MTVGQIDAMPHREYMGWIEFHEVEPFGLVVADSLNAHSCSVAANLRRDSAARLEPYGIKDFLVFSKPEKASSAASPMVDGKTGPQWKLIFAAEAMQTMQNKERVRLADIAAAAPPEPIDE